MDNNLIISLFPGIDLLGKAFEQNGFCVVRGPDKIFGGDIQKFHPPKGVFFGAIGGPPCQDFSPLRRIKPTGYGLQMLREFVRTVTEASPEWWLLENVSRVPSVTNLDGHIFAQLSHTYTIQRFDIDQSWYCDVSRLRHIQFGSKSGRLLNVTRRSRNSVTQPAALANDDRDFKTLCNLQGLPDDFDLPGWTVKGKKTAVGNGVPMVMGDVLARAVLEAYSKPLGKSRLCGCSCGRPVTGKAKYYDYSCRKRAQRKRDQFGHTVTHRGKK